MVFVRVYGPNQRDLVVREAGSRASELRLRADGALESRPRLSPSGEHVAFIRQRDDVWRVCVVPVRGGDAVCVADSSADGAVGWSADGATLLFSRGGTLFTVPYSVTTEEVGPEVDTGVAVPGGWFATSPDGTRIVLAEGRRLLIRQVDGSGSTSIEVPRAASEVSFAPDGQRLLYTSEYQLHVVGVGGGAVRQLTRPGTVNGEGTWTGAGDWVVFRSNRSGGGDLYAVKATAAGGDERELAQVTTTSEREITPSF
jgi:Tol biopolymer transport system component